MSEQLTKRDAKRLKIVVIALLPLLLPALDTVLALAFGWRPRAFNLKLIAVGLVALPPGAALMTYLLRHHLARYWTRVLLCSLVFFGGSLIAEGVLKASRQPTRFHLFPPNLDWQLEPKNLRGVSGLTVFSTNSLGVRAAELPKPSVPRVWCVGGSTTECLYLDDKETWPALLEKRLSTPSRPLWIGNAGRSGYSSVEHAHFLETSPLLRSGDLVLLLVGINDLQHFCFAKRSPADYASAFVSRRPLWQRSASYDLLRFVSLSWKQPTQDSQASFYASLRARRSQATAMNMAPPLETAAASYRERLRRIVSTCKRRRLRLLVLSQPVLWREDLPPEECALLWFGGAADGTYYSAEAMAKGMAAFNRVLLEVAEEADAPVIDIARRLNGRPEYFYDDCHFTEAGAAAVASELAPVVGPLLANEPLKGN